MRRLFRRMRRLPDFDDCRSMKVILVPHCVLNQNARSAGAAERPAAVTELIAGLMGRGIGIVQMPCPELQIMGLNRGGAVSIRTELERAENRVLCRRIAGDLVFQIREYQSRNIEVLGILGKNGSPTCGVEETWDNGVTAGTGAFIEEFKRELHESCMAIRMAGIRDAAPAAALALVDLWLEQPG